MGAKQQLLLLASVVISNLLLIAVYIFFLGFTVPSPLYYYLFAFRFLTDVLPVAILHIQYLTVNWHSELIINKIDRTIKYKDQEKNIEYNISEIQSLHYYASYGRGTGWYSFEGYRYFRIVFSDQSEIIITSLMANKIEKEFSALLGIEPEKHLSIIPLISRQFNPKVE